MKRFYNLLLCLLLTAPFLGHTQNVGVDVASPVQKLDVAGALKIGSTSNGVAGSIRWDGTNFQVHNGTTWINFGSGTDLYWTLVGSDVYPTFGGNVGIGTTTPATKLQVVGTARVSALNVNGNYTLPTTDGGAGFVLSTDGAGAVSWTNPALVGDITSVTAGNGLAGGGTNGAVTLDVNVDGSTITINTDVLGVPTGGITTTQILDGTIVTGDISTGGVTSANILDGTIVTGDIATGGVTSTNILDATILTGDISVGGVTSTNILNATILPADMASGGNDQVLTTNGTGTVQWISQAALANTLEGDGLVFDGLNNEIDVNVDNSTVEVNADVLRVRTGGITTTQILDGTIVTGDIATGGVTSTNILDATILTGDISVGGVTSGNILDETILATDIATGAVTTSEILNATILPADVAAGANNTVLSTNSLGVVGWNNPATLTTVLQDRDADTRINVDNGGSPDDDFIRMTTVGTERMTIDNSGQVGIGTNTPNRNLHVIDATGGKVLVSRADPTTIVNETLGEIMFDSEDDTDPSSTDASAVIRGIAAEDHGNSNKGGHLTFLTKALGGGGSTLAATEHMRITNTGNVGIGLTVPTFKLHVAGDIHPDGKIVVQNAVDGGASRGIYMWTASDPNWGIYMGQSGATRSLSGGTAVGGGGFTSHAIRTRVNNDNTQGIIFENSAESLLFSVRGGDGQTYHKGNVGINTDPSAKLHVLVTNDQNGNPDANGIYVQSNDNSGDNGDAIITTRVAGAGGGDPFFSMDVNGVTGWSMGIDNSDEDKLKFANSWSDPASNTRMTIKTDGNVGIGNTAPAHTLDVGGKARFRRGGYDMGSANNGQIEVSNTGSGDAYISFHREGAWGAHFGLEADNWFTTRGWSPGASGYTSLRVGSLAVNGNLTVTGTFPGDNLGNHSATTTLNMNANTIATAGDILSTNNYGQGLVGVYSSVRYQNVWAMGTSWRLPADGTTPGNLYGLAWTHSNVGGQSIGGLSHQLLVMENGATKVALGSGIWTNGTSYMPFIYDQQNTGYYLDPNSTSRQSVVITDENYTYGWFRNYNTNTGLYNQATGRHFYSESGSYWTTASGNGMIFRTSHAGSVMGYTYHDGGSSFGSLSPNGNWRFRCDNSNTEAYGNGFYAPTSWIGFIYDRDNSGYYLDPNGNSQTSSIYNNNWFRAQGQSGFYFQDYGGGWQMVDGTWIRAYNSKPILATGGVAGYGNAIGNWYGIAANMMANYNNATSAGIVVSDDGGFGDWNTGWVEYRGSTGLDIRSNNTSWNMVFRMGNQDNSGVNDKLVATGSANWGLLGGSSNYWYRVYAGGFVTSSKRETKRDITPIEGDLSALIMSDIEKLKPSFYKYKVETDEYDETKPMKYRPNFHLGLILEESPDYLKDEQFSGIDNYSTATLGVLGAKVNHEEIKKLKRNVQDFGSVPVTATTISVAFNEEFAEAIAAGSSLPVVTVNANLEGVIANIVEKTTTGFKVKVNKVEPGLMLDYIAMGKSVERDNIAELEGNVSPEIIKGLRVEESIKQDQYKREAQRIIDQQNLEKKAQIDAIEIQKQRAEEIKAVVGDPAKETGIQGERDAVNVKRIAEEALRNYVAVPEDAPARSGTLGDPNPSKEGAPSLEPVKTPAPNGAKSGLELHPTEMIDKSKTKNPGDGVNDPNVPKTDPAPKGESGSPRE